MANLRDYGIQENEHMPYDRFAAQVLADPEFADATEDDIISAYADLYDREESVMGAVGETVDLVQQGLYGGLGSMASGIERATDSERGSLGSQWLQGRADAQNEDLSPTTKAAMRNFKVFEGDTYSTRGFLASGAEGLGSAVPMFAGGALGMGVKAGIAGLALRGGAQAAGKALAIPAGAELAGVKAGQSLAGKMLTAAKNPYVLGSTAAMTQMVGGSTGDEVEDSIRQTALENKDALYTDPDFQELINQDISFDKAVDIYAKSQAKKAYITAAAASIPVSMVASHYIGKLIGGRFNNSLVGSTVKGGVVELPQEFADESTSAAVAKSHIPGSDINIWERGATGAVTGLSTGLQMGAAIKAPSTIANIKSNTLDPVFNRNASILDISDDAIAAKIKAYADVEANIEGVTLEEARKRAVQSVIEENADADIEERINRMERNADAEDGTFYEQNLTGKLKKAKDFVTGAVKDPKVKETINKVKDSATYSYKTHAADIKNVVSAAAEHVSNSAKLRDPQASGLIDEANAAATRAYDEAMAYAEENNLGDDPQNIRNAVKAAEQAFTGTIEAAKNGSVTGVLKETIATFKDGIKRGVEPIIHKGEDGKSDLIDNVGKSETAQKVKKAANHVWDLLPDKVKSTVKGVVNVAEAGVQTAKERMAATRARKAEAKKFEDRLALPAGIDEDTVYGQLDEDEKSVYDGYKESFVGSVKRMDPGGVYNTIQDAVNYAKKHPDKFKGAAKVKAGDAIHWYANTLDKMRMKKPTKTEKTTQSEGSHIRLKRASDTPFADDASSNPTRVTDDLAVKKMTATINKIANSSKTQEEFRDRLRAAKVVFHGDESNAVSDWFDARQAGKTTASFEEHFIVNGGKGDKESFVDKATKTAKATVAKGAQAVYDGAKKTSEAMDSGIEGMHKFADRLSPRKEGDTRPEPKIEEEDLTNLRNVIIEGEFTVDEDSAELTPEQEANLAKLEAKLGKKRGGKGPDLTASMPLRGDVRSQTRAPTAEEMQGVGELVTNEDYRRIATSIAQGKPLSAYDLELVSVLMGEDSAVVKEYVKLPGVSKSAKKSLEAEEVSRGLTSVDDDQVAETYRKDDETGEKEGEKSQITVSSPPKFSYKLGADKIGAHPWFTEEGIDSTIEAVNTSSRRQFSKVNYLEALKEMYKKPEVLAQNIKLKAAHIRRNLENDVVNRDRHRFLDNVSDERKAELAAMSDEELLASVYSLKEESVNNDSYAAEDLDTFDEMSIGYDATRTAKDGKVVENTHELVKPWQEREEGVDIRDVTDIEFGWLPIDNGYAVNIPSATEIMYNRMKVNDNLVTRGEALTAILSQYLPRADAGLVMASDMFNEDGTFREGDPDSFYKDDMVNPDSAAAYGGFLRKLAGEIKWPYDSVKKKNMPKPIPAMDLLGEGAQQKQFIKSVNDIIRAKALRIAVERMNKQLRKLAIDGNKEAHTTLNEAITKNLAELKTLDRKLAQDKIFGSVSELAGDSQRNLLPPEYDGGRDEIETELGDDQSNLASTRLDLPKGYDPYDQVTSTNSVVNSPIPITMIDKFVGPRAETFTALTTEEKDSAYKMLLSRRLSKDADGEVYVDRTPEEQAEFDSKVEELREYYANPRGKEYPGIKDPGSYKTADDKVKGDLLNKTVELIPADATTEQQIEMSQALDNGDPQLIIDTYNAIHDEVMSDNHDNSAVTRAIKYEQKLLVWDDAIVDQDIQRDIAAEQKREAYETAMLARKLEWAAKPRAEKTRLAAEKRKRGMAKADRVAAILRGDVAPTAYEAERAKYTKMVRAAAKKYNNASDERLDKKSKFTEANNKRMRAQFKKMQDARAAEIKNTKVPLSFYKLTAKRDVADDIELARQTRMAYAKQYAADYTGDTAKEIVVEKVIAGKKQKLTADEYVKLMDERLARLEETIEKQCL